MPDLTPLPIDELRDQLTAALAGGPVVITAPTGSGKSTQVPRWLGERGRVLVIEPRRVACRGLAARVAELEGARLGERVGYAVRDDRRFGDGSSIVFATPGVVLRWFADRGLAGFDAVVLDEFHERGLETDLLLALLAERYPGPLVVMSATLDGDRVARHLGGSHLAATGRLFEIATGHVPGQALLPDPRGLEERAAEALARAADDPGDVLVFLPGKAEIARLGDRLAGRSELEVLPIHGGLSLAEQSRVFTPHQRRRVILATNVAETSITIPGIGVVIDSGLVRRTRYVNGRGFLTLAPVALDSAEQRAGRAGRTAPGTCYRLWSPEAVLAPVTPPEIHRESLAQLLLAAACCDADARTLPFLDPPKEYALESAIEELAALGALADDERITDRGRRLYGLPLDAPHAGLLVEAEREGCLPTAIDLVAVLAVGRPLFQGERRPIDPDDDLRLAGCDGLALIRAVREGDPHRHGLSRFVLDEARRIRRRLRQGWQLPEAVEPVAAIDRLALIRAALLADPRSAHVARRRKGRVFWSNGGTEIELARESAVKEEATPAIAVLGSIAIGQGFRRSRVYATCALPVTHAQLAAARLGQDRVEHATRERGKVTARIERIYAGQVIERREEVPRGALARRAIVDLFLAGRIFEDSLAATRERLESAALLSRLHAAGLAPEHLEAGPWEGVSPIPELPSWVADRIDRLGVESGDDLALLSAGDLRAPALPAATLEWLDQQFPRRLVLGDAAYEAAFDLPGREVTLVRVKGQRKQPPSLAVLPSFKGFRIRVKHHSKVWVLKER